MKNFNDVLENYLEKSSNKGADAFNEILEAIAKVRNVTRQDVLNYNCFAFNSKESTSEAKSNALEKLQEIASSMDATINVKEYFELISKDIYYYDNKNNKWVTKKDMYETIYHEYKKMFKWNIAINDEDVDNGYYKKHYQEMYESFPHFYSIYQKSMDEQRFEYILNKFKKVDEFLDWYNEEVQCLKTLYQRYKHENKYFGEEDILYIYKPDGCRDVKFDTVDLDELFNDGQYITSNYKWKVTPKNLFNRILKDNKLNDVELEKLDKLLNKEMTLKR